MDLIRQVPAKCRLSLLVGFATLHAIAPAQAVPNKSAVTPVLNMSDAEHSLFGSYLAGRFARGQRDMHTAAEFYRSALERDPANKEILREAFLSEVSVGNWRRATKLADDVVKSESEDRIANIMLGVRAMKHGELQAANRHFSKATVGPIGELTGTIARAWVLVGQKKPVQAFELLEKLNQAEWAKFYRNYHKALMADLANRNGLAKKTYQKLFDEGPRTQRLVVAYASHAAATGNTRLGRQILTKHLRSGGRNALTFSLLSRLHEGLAIPRVVSDSTEGIAELFYGLGEALTREGGLDVGTVYLQIALYLKPGFSEAQYALASVYESMNKHEAAIEAYEKIPANAPFAVESVVGKAMNLDRLDRLDEAKSVLTELFDELIRSAERASVEQGARASLTKSDDRNEQVRSAQGLLKQLALYSGPVDGILGPQTIRAIRAFQREQGLAQDGIVGPNTLGALASASSGYEIENSRRGRLLVLRTLGNLLRGKKKYPAAVEYYSRAIELIEEPAKRDWNHFYARGICYERLKQWPKAEADLKKALELYPDQPLALNYLGYSWVDQNRNVREAMELIRKAVKIKPDDGYFVDSLGWAYYRQGNYSAAAEYLERAVELRPEDPVINDHLGDAYWHVGRKLEARFQWSQSLTLNPEPEEVPKIKAKIANGLDDQHQAKVVRKVSKIVSEDEQPVSSAGDITPLRQ